MPHSPSDQVLPVSGNGNSLDASLSRAVDAMNLLRDDLRREGLSDLADHLDDIVVKCLSLYLERENIKAALTRPDIPKGADSTPK